jgi:alkylation response protein AidB-like acyl-CoA dehydrogenase
MDERTHNLIDECKRLEESCLYTSTTLFEWLKRLRLWKGVFVVAPIVLGALAAWPILKQQMGHEWLTGVCALLAGIAPAVYKALDLDVSLDTVAKHAHQAKTLQDRFRQAWRVTALGSFEDFKNEFDDLMTRVDAARSTSLTAPERFFKKAQEKIAAGHYTFSVDEKKAEGEKLHDRERLP